MPRYIDADQIITVTYFDEEHREWSQKSKTIEDCLAEVSDEEIQTLDVPERKVGKWIPVRERLPEYKQKVLCCVNGRIYIDERGLRGWRFRVTDYDAWMPLPEPWKGES